MVFPIVGGNQSSGDFITNSLRYNYGDSPKLIKSGTSAGSTTFTFSAWLKFSVTNFYNFIFCSGNQIGLAKDRTQSGGQFYLNGASGGTYTNSDGFQRDPSAWYHAVVSCNSGTGIIYVNNVNRKGSINIPQFAVDLAIGHFMRTDGVETPQYNYYMDGYMAEVHFVDGTALNPTSFGETNDNGVWVPKDCKDDLTYGTNGFYLQFKETGTSANASGIGADTSGNDNHFTPTNFTALDITTDTPQNNFATLNLLSRRLTNNDPTYSEGNVKLTGQTGDGQNNNAIATIQHLKSGKWYFEVKCTTDGDAFGVGISDNPVATNGNAASNSNHVWYNLDGTINYGTTSSGSYGNTYTDGDIIGVAFDLDNGAIYFYKNGTIQNSGTAARTDLLTTMVEGYTPIGFTNKGVMEFNFGNPSFSISSGNSDGNGYGNFEYAVPSGYYALCTKNLAEYG